MFQRATLRISTRTLAVYSSCGTVCWAPTLPNAANLSWASRCRAQQYALAFPVVFSVLVSIASCHVQLHRHEICLESLSCLRGTTLFYPFAQSVQWRIEHALSFFYRRVWRLSRRCASAIDRLTVWLRAPAWVPPGEHFSALLPAAANIQLLPMFVLCFLGLVSSRLGVQTVAAKDPNPHTLRKMDDTPHLSVLHDAYLALQFAIVAAVTLLAVIERTVLPLGLYLFACLLSVYSLCAIAWMCDARGGFVPSVAAEAGRCALVLALLAWLIPVLR